MGGNTVRVVWCGVVWCGVVWCGVVWCGVVWCEVYHHVSIRAHAMDSDCPSHVHLCSASGMKKNVYGNIEDIVRLSPSFL